MISANEKRVYRNTLALTLRTFLTIPIGFFSVRLALSALGAENYGMATLLSGLTAVTLVLSACVANATRRFFCVEVAGADTLRMRRLFSQAVQVYWGTAFLFALLMDGLGCWMILYKIKMPAENLGTAILFYQTVVFAFVAQYIGGLYSVFLTAYEHITTIAWVSLLESVVHIGFLGALCLVPQSHVFIAYGMVSGLTYMVTALLYYGIVRHRFPVISAYRPCWERKVLGNMFSFALWKMATGISGSLCTIANGVLLNNYFGSVLNAAQGVASIVVGKVSGFGFGLMSASQPQLIKLYAQHQIKAMEILFVRVTKFAVFILVGLAVPVLVNLDFLLDVWLDEPPIYCNWFVLLGFLTAMTDVTCVPGATIVDATGRIRGMQIVGCFCPWLFFGVVYFGLGYDLGPLWVPITVFIASVVGNVVRFYFIKRTIPEFRLLFFFSSFLYRVAPVVLCGVTCIVAVRVLFSAPGWLTVFLTSCASFLAVITTIAFHGLTPDERQEIVAVITGRLSRMAARMKR